MDQEVDYPDGEHVMFLLYWLNRFIFPSASNCITMEWLHLAEGLSSYRDIATGPLILASIYRALREATVEPINLNVKGPCGWFRPGFSGLFLNCGPESCGLL
ncbi:uncharacterized protein Pyn_02419 [Prunus yedoensis var. nudiflora]|uniref:Aminotransferase-like plant mobile domain-containing protein n=1 Tax=Prunus yedoensis var. nudiflora TaxID=2094558 RepID=A0A314UD60_PRUYE|nr:uncharacterized protein Pyn_02419 [Prunus yedoensis var. nudiflora]